MREVDLGKGYERFLSPLTRKMSGVQFPLAPLRTSACAGVLFVTETVTDQRVLQGANPVASITNRCTKIDHVGHAVQSWCAG